MATLDLEGARPGDLVGVSFADRERQLYGQLYVAAAAGAPTEAWLAVFAGPQTLRAERLQSGPPEIATASAQAWTARWSPSGADGLELELEAVGPPAELSQAEGNGRGPALDALIQAARARGRLRLAGEERPIEGLGQVSLDRGAARSVADVALRRELSAYRDGGVGVALRALRQAGEVAHEDEIVRAVLIEGDPLHAATIDEARLSTAYDAEGVQRRAGLELWPTEDADYPRRAAGQALCAASVSDGPAGARWDCAFLDWHMEGSRAIGPYSILRSS